MPRRDHCELHLTDDELLQLASMEDLQDAEAECCVALQGRPDPIRSRPESIGGPSASRSANDRGGREIVGEARYLIRGPLRALRVDETFPARRQCRHFGMPEGRQKMP